MLKSELMEKDVFIFGYFKTHISLVDRTSRKKASKDKKKT